MRRILLIALLTLTAARAAHGTVFEGRVASAAGEPLAGVSLSVSGPSGFRAAATSDERGRFSIDLPGGGEYVLRLEKEGYAALESPFTIDEGQWQNADIKLVTAASQRRTEAVRAYNAGAKAFDARELRTAKGHFLAAIEADSSLAEPFLPLAEIYLRQSAHAEAAAAAERYLALRPGDRQAQRIAYEAYRALDDPRASELRRLLAGDANAARKLAVQTYEKGELADQRGDRDTAAARFREAIQLDGELAVAHLALAGIEYREGRYPEALAAIEATLALEPANVEAHRYRFLIHDARGDRPAADEAMESYLEVDADGAARLLHGRAELGLRTGETELARRILLRILESKPQFARAHFTLGRSYTSSDAALAKHHLEKFIVLATDDDPDLPEARALLGNL